MESECDNTGLLGPSENFSKVNIRGRNKEIT